MGLVLSCFSGSMASLGCCFTQAACRMCCNSFPTAKYSTATRIGYAFTLIIGAIFSYLTRINFVKDWLIKIPAICDGLNPNDCKNIVSQEITIRIWMCYSIFFLFMSIFTIDVRTSHDIRAMFHTGFWIFKLIILTGIGIGLAFVKVSSQFSYICIILGYIGTFIFLLIQLILLIDFVHVWNSSWTAKAEDTSSNVWFGGLFTFTVLMYLISITLIVCSFQFLAKSPTEMCHLNKFFTSFQLICSIAISFIAILPSVQDHIPTSGLLQASAISLYTSYLIFSALSLNTSSSCNQLASNTSKTIGHVLSIVSTIFTLFMVVFTSIENNDSGKTQMLGIQNDENEQVPGNIHLKNDGTNVGSRQAQEVYDDEEDGVTYSYSLFHLMLLMCSLYMMMLMTNWYNPNKLVNGDKIGTWVKIVTSWFCFFIYTWTLLAPMIFTDRDFGYD